MTTLLRQHDAAVPSIRPLIDASAATIDARPSLLDRIALRVALRLLLWSARRTHAVRDAHDLAVRRRANASARFARELAWQRRLDLVARR